MMRDVAAGCLRALDRGAVAVLGAAIRGYQRSISPWLGANCRFQPTCSTYFLESLRKHGCIRGGLRGMARICRCHPWSAGGVDPP